MVKTFVGALKAALECERSQLNRTIALVLPEAGKGKQAGGRKCLHCGEFARHEAEQFFCTACTERYQQVAC